MDQSNSMETNDRTHLSDQTKFRLNVINKIDFYLEIKERKLNSKKYISGWL